MKKIFFLFAAIYVMSLISFKDPKKDSQSFTAIIKKDPSKIQELLQVADSLRQHSLQKRNPIDKEDKKNPGELKEFRNKKDPFKVDGNEYPIIKISMEDIMEIIDPEMTSLNVRSSDSLTFYLGKYHDGKWVERYNKRNKPKDPVKFKDLKDRPALLIGTSNKTLLPTYYDVQRICPPPADAGCN